MRTLLREKNPFEEQRSCAIVQRSSARSNERLSLPVNLCRILMFRVRNRLGSQTVGQRPIILVVARAGRRFASGYRNLGFAESILGKRGIWIVRIGFWTTGILAGAVLTYTTRFFLNTDGVNYIELGEAFNVRGWPGLVNLTTSPAYAFLLGSVQELLHTNPTNELTQLKVVNFVGLLLAMVGCEMFVWQVQRHMDQAEQNGELLLHRPVMLLLIYGTFLVAALVWVKVRTIAPELFVFALVLAAMTVILRIRQAPAEHCTSWLLGVTMGIGYLTKSFFLPFSAVFLFLAGLCAGSLKKAIFTISVGISVMLLIGAPLMFGLTNKIGRFSYGEAGNFNYAKLVSGRGVPIHPPTKLNLEPKVLYFKDGPGGTFPGGFDLAYWSLGVYPVFELDTQLTVLARNVLRLFSQDPWFFFFVAIWFVSQSLLGSLRIGRVLPPSLMTILAVPALAGIGLFCLVEMEIRYCAPFVFLGLVALFACPRYRPDSKSVPRYAVIGSLGLAAVMIAQLGLTVVDESIRGLYSTDTKLSYQDRFLEQVRVKDFLKKSGLKTGDYTAVVGSPHHYWARMAGVRIMAEIPDVHGFLSTDQSRRRTALKSLAEVDVKIVVGKFSGFGTIEKEGWIPVPGTQDYFVLPLRADLTSG
ncbi:MAG: hypothetical protein HY912_12345 [Desulfomonile tiedjei]|uniref:Uncharacterized protein n=1 Tax=Desulfomonile tiedjei TaxID=2358 RepID=A0A9D6Z6N4_9BACT|nr:hypothetical protein [Desulfomonile tiedjei]